MLHRLTAVLLFFCALAGPAFSASRLFDDVFLSDPDALTDQSIDVGTKDIAAAWLIAPTTRYDHHVHPTQYEAGGLRVQMTSGPQLTLMLDDTHVFEDRHARLADFGNDGHAEIVVVLSDIHKGASLAVYGVDGRKIVLIAQTPYIGKPHRWLDPAGIADFDGDGRLEVAIVMMPHLEKRLELWGFDASGSFRKEAEVPDVANHRNGSRWSEMADHADFNGDGAIDLVIPSGDRNALRIISFAGDTPTELDRTDLPYPADGHFDLWMDGGEYQVSLGLEQNYPAQVRFCNFSTRC